MITYQTLIDDMAAGCKPKNEWRIGLEHEQFAMNAADGSALSYNGTPGIRQLLDALAHTYGWEKVMEESHPIALKKDAINVTLEPGGQFEYSGSPLPSLKAAKAEMDAFYSDLSGIVEKLGIEMLSRGLHPQWDHRNANWMPKARYDIMGPYMQTRGTLGVEMMVGSCGTQINLDFDSEADMVKKYRTALGLQPVITALMANSHMREGKDTGFKSFRSHLWTDTDPDRCGNLPFVFDEDMGFARYVDYVLDVPMYFFKRGGRYINAAGQSFRDFMAGKLEGHEGETPTLDDWHDHMTTVFPEVRLKKGYLELRGADSNPPEIIYAMAAFWAGIFYDETALDNAYKMVMQWPAPEHEKLRDAVPKTGLDTATPDGRNLCAWGQDALEIAANGLSRYEADAAPMLAPFRGKLSGCNAPVAKTA